MSLVGWIIAVGGPLLGIAAVVALVLAHEHGRQLWRLPVRVPSAPMAARRASTALLDDYLIDERAANAAARRQRHARLLMQARRASTMVLEEFLDERAVPAPVAEPVRVALPVRPVPRAVLARAHERAPRPTRLVPLAPEIAIG